MFLRPAALAAARAVAFESSKLWSVTHLLRDVLAADPMATGTWPSCSAVDNKGESFFNDSDFSLDAEGRF